MILPVALTVLVHNVMAYFLAYRVMRSPFSKGLYYALGVAFIPIHELSHALACLVFRHKITGIRLVSFDGGLGGYVNHSWNAKSLYQRLGLFFIAIAPLLTAIALLYTAQREGWLELPDTRNLSAYGAYYWLVSTPITTVVIFSSLCFYCIPSIQDFKNSIKSVFINALMAILFVYLLLNVELIEAWELQEIADSFLSGSVLVSLFSIVYWVILWLISFVSRD